MQPEGMTPDRVRAYFGMRKFSVGKDRAGIPRLFLNDRPYFHHGVLDQGYWPDTLLTPPSDQAMVDDIALMKRFGFNMLRKHVKIEPARWYYHCDRLGMLVWQDMVNGGQGYHAWFVTYLSTVFQFLRGRFGEKVGELLSRRSRQGKEEYRRELFAMIRQLGNAPCIALWVPFNEGWGQFDTEAVVDYTREIDSTRLINSASGGNSVMCGDILDSHNYPRPIMKFRSNGAQIDVLGDYGGIGLALPGHLWQEDNNWGYKGLCKDSEELLDKYARYADMFIPEILSGVSAGVYTQTTDVEGEVNGLMTYDRKIVKMDEQALRAVNEKVISTLNHE